jgi:adenylate cyclase
LARRAVALNEADAEARSSLAFTLLMRGDHHSALAEAEHALALSPNLAAAHGEKGAALIFSARPTEGLAALQTCIRLDPHDPLLRVRLLHKATAFYLCRDYEAAVDAAADAIRLYPDYPGPYRWLAAALGQLESQRGGERSAEEGRRDRARHIRPVCPWARAMDASTRQSAGEPKRRWLLVSYAWRSIGAVDAAAFRFDRGKRCGPFNNGELDQYGAIC